MTPCTGLMAGTVYAILNVVVISLCYEPLPGEPPWPAGSEFVTIATHNGNAIPMPIETTNRAQIMVSNPLMGDKIRSHYMVCEPNGVNCTEQSPKFKLNYHGDWDLKSDGTIGTPDFITFRGFFGTTNPTVDYNQDGTVGTPEFLDFSGKFGWKRCDKDVYVRKGESCP